MIRYKVANMAVKALLLSFLILTGCNSSDPAEIPKFQYQSKLTKFDSCDDLTGYLLDTAEKESRLIDYYFALPGAVGDPDQPALAEDFNAVSDTDGGDQNSIDTFTGTNNQVTGVDEADFVKTDGEYTYIVSGGYFLIFDTWPAAQSEELSRTKLDGSPAALFVHANTAWVVSHIYESDSLVNSVSFAPRVQLLTRVSLFDISKPDAPELMREITLEARYLDARRIGSRVHMVAASQINILPLLDNQTTPQLNELLPVLTDTKLTPGDTSSTTELISQCDSIFQPGTANGTGTVSLLSFDLQNPQSSIQRQSIIGNGGTVYANQQHLYIASMEDQYWILLPQLEADVASRPGTTLHKFMLQDEPTYLASGRVDGHLVNQFAMDEYNNLLRTVTTDTSWWSDDPPKNSLYILQQQNDTLVVRSQLTDLGKKGERIFAARFIKDRGFLVTYQQIDPLYTLDLSDADNPRVAGELEVPGVSTYLHPIDDDLLLAVGRNDISRSVELSLFDTTDFDHPSLLHRQSIGSGSYSEAEYNHKAFTWFAAEKLLALPVTRWNGDFFTDAALTQFDAFNGLQLYKVDKDTGINLQGEVDHSNFYRDNDTQLWYYPENIRRSFFVADTDQNSYLYSISSRGLKVNATNQLGTDLAELPLPAYDYGVFY